MCLPSDSWIVPSGKQPHFAIENDPVEIVDFPSYKMVILHRFLYVYQRQSPLVSEWNLYREITVLRWHLRSASRIPTCHWRSSTEHRPTLCGCFECFEVRGAEFQQLATAISGTD